MTRRAWAFFIFAISLLTAAQASAQFVNPDYGGERYAVFVDGNLGWSYTSDGIGPGFGYGASAGFLARYDSDFGSAYAGVGAYYLASDPDPGRVNAFGGELLLRYKVGTLGVLLGAAQLKDVAGVPSTLHFGWGAYGSIDFPVYYDIVTFGPGAAVILFRPNDQTYATYWGFVSLKFWW